MNDFTHVRIAKDLLADVEALAKRMGAHPRYEGLPLTTSAVARMAIVKGLAIIESEMGADPPAKRKTKGGR